MSTAKYESTNEPQTVTIYRTEQTTAREAVKWLKEKNFTFEAIGKILGISRQRAHQIYQTRSDHD